MANTKLSQIPPGVAALAKKLVGVNGSGPTDELYTISDILALLANTDNTIFSDSIEGFTPTLSAQQGGSWTPAGANYFNIGGIKFALINISYSSDGSGAGHCDFTLPTGLFSEVLGYLPTIAAEGNYAYQIASGDSLRTSGDLITGAGVYVSNTGSSGSCRVCALFVGI